MDGTSTMSPADLHAVMEGNGGGEGFGGGAWWIIILFLFVFMGGGWGGNGAGQAATANDIQKAVDLNSIQQGQANIASELQRGIYEINNNTQHVAYDNLGEIRDVQAAMATGFANTQNTLTAMQANMQNCCCTTQRAIDGVNYNLATQSAAIQATDTANTQKILDAIATNRMAAMQDQINQLQLQNAVAGVVRYPTTSAYCSGANPFYSGCGCSSI